MASAPLVPAARVLVMERIQVLLLAATQLRLVQVAVVAVLKIQLALLAAAATAKTVW
jgi:hypothetical protein